MTPIRLDRYLLSLMLRPLVACLVVSLFAVMLERLLEVVTEIAQEGGQLLIWRLLGSLASIYASDILPAAFLFGTFLVVARLGDDSEIDAMLASGVSIGRLAAPFLATGVTLALASLILFGFLQPYGRYGYKTAMFDSANSGWSAEVRPGMFLDAGDGYVIAADESGLDGRNLKGVFIRRALPGDVEEITTARSGVLHPLLGGREVAVELKGGLQLEERPERTRLKRFQSAEETAPVSLVNEVMRPRGADTRELTLPELIRAFRNAPQGQPPRGVSAELFARLAECLAIPFVPLIAIPLGMAAKRGRRTSGLILGGLLLLGFKHGLQFAKSLAQTGHFAPAPAITAVFSIWVGLCLWLFASSQQRPGDTPVSRLMDALQARIDRARALFAVSEVSSTSDSVAV